MLPEPRRWIEKRVCRPSADVCRCLACDVQGKAEQLVKVNQALEALRQRQEAGEAEIRASVGLQPASCCCCMCRG